MKQEEIIEKLEALKLERELPNEQTTDYNVGYVKALCIAMKLVEKLNIPPVIKWVHLNDLSETQYNKLIINNPNIKCDNGDFKRYNQRTWEDIVTHVAV